MKLVIVESPAKAKTINKYLGKDYHVLASFGHVRDLPSKDGSVNPDDGFSMLWEVDARSEKHIKEITNAVKKADEVLLATDPDREGEAISWHVLEILKNGKALKDIPVRRVVFHEITKKAINEAIKHPRDLDQDLIEAYLARRALDYLVGFTISPVLWRKLPGSRSAGRVQSVALRLITDREDEIEAFNTEEYWSILGDFLGKPSKKVKARLTHLKSKKLAKFDINNEALATDAVNEIKKHAYSVLKVEKKQAKRNPSPPFTTSTLQQEAARKLGFGASRTMKLAQQLYEGVNLGGETTGLITYMRTDSVNLGQEALDSLRIHIEKVYGKDYLPEEMRLYKTKAKNAQEAHEAIRPTDIARHPKDVAEYLDPTQLKLYELIWKRTIASQMASAILDQVSADISNPEKSVIFRANGSTIRFDGFLKVYQEGRDEEANEDEEEDEKILPPLTEGEGLDLTLVTPNQHFTQPPPRYSEASLVKKLEELGIGRPSTYASIINTLQDRGYVKLEKKQFFPEDRGRIVTAFLLNFFAKYVEYDFTANLEEQLDDISGGRLNWKKVLTQFWGDFIKAVEEAKGLTITQVIDRLNHDLDGMLFPPREDGSDRHICPKCKEGKLSLKLGKFGAFIGCSNYPECQYTRKLSTAGDTQSEVPMELMNENKELGPDPKSGLMVTLRKGPYGFYFQWGEPVGKEKPKRVTLPKGLQPQDATLENALEAGALPRVVGNHPATGEEIIAGIGRYGPYVKYQDRFISLKAGDDPISIDLDRAVHVIDTAPEKKPKR
jgi:DNA topoisomerase I